MDKKILVGVLRLMDSPRKDVQKDLFVIVKAFFDSKREQKGYAAKDEVFQNGEDFINDQFKNPWEVLGALTPDYHHYEDFVGYNKYMQLVSSDYIFDLTDESKVADFVIANKTDLQSRFPWEFEVLKELYEEDAA